MFDPEIVSAPRQGGGVTQHEGCRTYVDLIATDLSTTSADHPQFVDLFRAFALHTQGEANFGYAEIGSDTRLRDALCVSEPGKEFYASLVDKAPLLTISNDVLGNANNTKNVSVFLLKELNDNPIEFINKIYAASLKGSPSGGGYALDKIEYLNTILSLKPGMFGVSINANLLIQKWIAKKRAETANKNKS